MTTTQTQTADTQPGNRREDEMSEKLNLGTRVNPEIAESLREYCGKSGRSISHVVNAALDEYLRQMWETVGAAEASDE